MSGAISKLRSTSRITSIFKSRMFILEQLEAIGYDISQYSCFDINQISAMYENDSMDMLLTSNTGTQVFIKYYISSSMIQQLKPANLDDMCTELFEVGIDSGIKLNAETDSLIVITEHDPKQSITEKLISLFVRRGIYVAVRSISSLQYNVLNSIYVPQHIRMTPEEVEQLKSRYCITNPQTELSEISRFDPPALSILLRPGDIVFIKRPSPTALFAPYYRYCVNH